jgi:glycosyltransferase involved in cell wall biosynthesis
MKNILYISQDGLVDPLGQSQIYPYVEGLSKNYFFFICTSESFENSNKINLFKKKINKNIDWKFNIIKKQSGKINRIIEILLLYSLVIKILFTKKISIIHCRSYLPMPICILVKLFTNKKIIFDTRGSWFDERIDGGMLKQKGLDYFIFKILKRLEAIFFKCSDYLVFLTENSLNKINPKFIQNKKFEIIPCAADFKHFKILDTKEKEKIKKQMSLSNKFVIAYIGSLGSWYQIEKIVSFFSQFKNIYKESYLLILTCSLIEKQLTKFPNNLSDSFCFLSCSREDMPKIIGISDLTLSFIKNSFSKFFSSPTKIGESFACGVPVLSTANIGDIDTHIKTLDLGYILNDKNFVSNSEFESLIQKKNNSKQIRQNSYDIYSLDSALLKYNKIYQSL